MRSLLVLVIAIGLATSARAQPYHDGHLMQSGEAQIIVTINPEARVSAVVGSPLPAPPTCGSAMELKVKVVNQGFVTAPLRAGIIGDGARHVAVNMDDTKLSGKPEDSRTLHLMPRGADLTDVTIAFSIDNTVGDLGGRDRVHLLLRCAPDNSATKLDSSATNPLDKVTIAYRKIGEHEILADAYRPRDNVVRPVIVSIHGGALIMGNRDSPGFPSFDVLAFVAEKGYALVSIDYRLAPETKLPDIIDDIEAAFRWIGAEGARKFRFDPDRLVVIGHSAGGYLTLVTGYRAKPKPKALVSLYGYGQLNADWSAKPNPYPNYNSKKFSEEDALKQTDGSVISDSRKRKGDGGTIYMYYRQNGLWPEEVSGFPRASISQLIAPYEPAKNVTRDYPPTFMMHGTQDTDVPFEESENMAAQFQAHGVPYLLVPIAKGEHGFVGGDRAQIEAGYRSAKEFMVRHLQPK